MMKSKKEKDLLNSLIQQQFDMDDHGLYIYGRREDYAHAEKNPIEIDEKIKDREEKEPKA